LISTAIHSGPEAAIDQAEDANVDKVNILKSDS
jgi:hypothetical protein